MAETSLDFIKVVKINSRGSGQYVAVIFQAWANGKLTDMYDIFWRKKCLARHNEPTYLAAKVTTA